MEDCAAIVANRKMVFNIPISSQITLLYVRKFVLVDLSCNEVRVLEVYMFINAATVLSRDSSLYKLLTCDRKSDHWQSCLSVFCLLGLGWYKT
eukprot:5712190-Amphidinium_carterae.2